MLTALLRGTVKLNVPFYPPASLIYSSSTNYSINNVNLRKLLVSSLILNCAV